MYLKTKLPFVKNILVSEMAADVVSELLSLNLQAEMRKSSEYNADIREESLKLIAQKFVNLLCSNTKNSEEFWEVVGSSSI